MTSFARFAIDYLKNESVSRSRNWCQIQSGISARIMSSEYFTRTSLYLGPRIRKYRRSIQKV